MTLIDSSETNYLAECKIEAYKENKNISFPHGYCLFTIPKIDTNIYYKNNSLKFSDDTGNIEIENDFYIIAQKCITSETEIVVNDKALFKIHSHSGSWCDYETGLGKVNIQIIQEGSSISEIFLFNMTLIDEYETNYLAECKIETSKENKNISYPYGYCLFTKPKINSNLYYKNNSLKISDASDNIKIENDFYIIAQKCITLNDTEIIANKSLIFRQINNFKYNINISQITFNFLALTSVSLKESSKINLLLFLIFEDEIIDSSLSEAICSLVEPVNPINATQVQANFNCSISDLDIGIKYKSVELNSSDYVVGIPEDKILLDPVKTNEAIENGELIDFSILENSRNIQPLFIPESIDGTGCSETGKYIIIGSLSSEIETKIEFLLKAAYPLNYISKCSIDKSSPGKAEINCITENDLSGKSLIFETQILREGLKELLTFESIKSDTMNCTKGNSVNNTIITNNTITNNSIQSDEIYENMTDESFSSNEINSITTVEDTDNVDIEKLNFSLIFRQLNNFKYDINASQITFDLNVLTSEILNERCKINLFLYLIFEDDIIDSSLSEAICSLVEPVNPINATQVQANFNCSISDLDIGIKYKSVELNSSDYVVGIPEDKILLDPVKTNEAIENGELIDFSILENSRNIQPLFIPESIDGTGCSETGKYIIIGSLSSEIETKIEFLLKAAYPLNYISKCSIDKSSPGKAEINCITENDLSGKSLIFETQILREGLKELLTFESIKSDTMNCTKGNSVNNTIITNNTITNNSIQSDEIYENMTDESFSSNIIIDKTSETETDIIDIEKLNLTLLFRQLNYFKYNINTSQITFDLYALTLKQLNKGYKIKLFLYLIFDDEIIDSSLSEATCTLHESVKPINTLTQADFDCVINGLDKETKYKSIELNSSDYLIAIPQEKILLDPVKTNESIENGDLIDYSISKNSNKNQPLFIPELIDGTSCSESGKYKILGFLNNEIKTKIEFILKAKYPANYISKCIIDKSKAGKTEINCEIGNQLSGQPLIFDTQIIRKGLNELLTFVNIKSDAMNCSKGNITLEDNPIIIPVDKTNISTDKLSSDFNSDENSFWPNYTSDSNSYHENNETFLNGTEKISEFLIDNISDISNNSIIDNNNETLLTDQINNSSNYSSSSDISSTSDSTLVIEPVYILDNALEKAKLKISFRQINNFIYNSGTIQFMLYALVTEPIKTGEEVKLNAYLIKANGEREDIVQEASCLLIKDVSPKEGESLQGDFNCSIKYLEEEYYSLKLINSDTISSLPEDEILLDPILTSEAIKKGKIFDYSNEINNSEQKIPPTFSPKNVIFNNCGSKGKFIIEGTLSKELTSESKFTIPLTYPDGVSIICNVNNREEGSSQIECQLDRDIDNKQIIIEQTVIKDGKDDVLILEGIHTSNNQICSNGLSSEIQKKENNKISFRQVSHLQYNGLNKFSFFLASLISKKINVGSIITMNIIVLIGEEKKIKKATCTLENSVMIEDDLFQGDYKCEVIINEDEYTKINFDDSKSIIISTDNDEISGVSGLEEEQLSPLATDILINKTNIILNNSNAYITDLADCMDYSEEENKEKIPPTLEISSLENLDECGKSGKFRIRGKFSEDIKQEIIFELPLSFPDSSVKCKVNDALANEEVEFICKVQKRFKLVKYFMIEQRIIKKRYKELLFVKSKSFSIDNSINCQNYNIRKYETSKKRQKLDISFMQLSKFKNEGKKVAFFMGLMRKRNEFEFQKMSFDIKVRYQSNASNKLRKLTNSYLTEDLTAFCDIIGLSKTACGLNCSSDKEVNGTPKGMQINTENINIAGIPDDADPSYLNNAVDYSIQDNLIIIDNLPNVTIKSIDGSNCEEDGSYIIEGIIEGGKLNNTSKVEIPFGFPDSSGLCNISVNNKEIYIYCQNKEKFSISPIIFETILVKDSLGKDLFKLNNYTNQKSFGCAISLNSSLSKASSRNNYNGTVNQFFFRKKSSNKISGGAIAAIIIVLILALIIIGIVVCLNIRRPKNPNIKENVSGSTSDSKENMEIEPEPKDTTI